MPLRRKFHSNPFARFASLLSALLFAGALTSASQTAVTTYHNDNYRTGWNSTETVLTPANVGSSSFGLLFKVKLDDQVDAQPLVVPGVNITAGKFPGTHDVVYVVTENDTVYAIDANTSTVLLTQSLGKPVQMPLGCNNNGPNVGINSTPVIDPSSNTLYVIAYTQDNTGPTYLVHALDLGSLTDKVTPEIVPRRTRLSMEPLLYLMPSISGSVRVCSWRMAMCMPDSAAFVIFLRTFPADGCSVGMRQR